MNEEQLNALLKGYKIAGVRRNLDLIMFEFEFAGKQSLALHAECFVHVAAENKLLLSTYDLYEPNPDLKTDEYGLDNYGSTLFDHSLDKNVSQIVGHEIINITYSLCEIAIYLSGGIMIRFLPNTTEKNREQLILFDDDNTYLWLWTDENEEGKIVDNRPIDG